MDVREPNSANPIRDRAIRLFGFLKELAQLKSTTVRDLAAYDEVIWFHAVPEYKGCFSILFPESDRLQESTWLEIRKSPEPKRPPVPPSCLKWLEDDTDSDLLAEPRLKDEIPAVDSGIDLQSREPSYSSPVIRLADNPRILQEWEHYIHDSWLPWSEVYRRWKAADEIYFRLFSIYQQIKKLGERYELLVGLGLLTWETPNNQRIRRHLVVGDAYLAFDADQAKFELQGAPEGVKLRFETEMIDQSYLPPLEEQRQLEELLGSVQESPWNNKDEIDKLLRSFVHLISPDGAYSDSMIPPDRPSRTPNVTCAPSIILRQRTQRSQIQCFNNIMEQVSNGGIIPLGLRVLCEAPGQVADNESEGTEANGGHVVDDTFYLPLPTNEEQKQIIHRIQSHRGILVQGPPGTGKSHTIANLISHLLAQGKRVLVTSQTPRALKVLKEKIPSEIKALCVTLLGNDQAARQELEGSVSGINLKYSDWNPSKHQEQMEELEAQLFEVRKNKAEKERLLREQREIDTYRYEVARGTYKGTAQQIALCVADEESKFAWLDDDVDIDEPCPVSNAELTELLQLYRELSEDDCSQLRKELLSRESIPEVALFLRMIEAEKSAEQNLRNYELRRHSLRFRTIEQLPEDRVGALRKSISDLIAAIGSVKTRFTWIPQATSDILTGNDMPWKTLRDFMADHLNGLKEDAFVAQSIDVKFPDSLDRKKLRADARELLEHLERGGKLGWKFLAPKVVRRNSYILKEVLVEGQLCSTLENLKLLLTYLDVLDEIERLWVALEGKDTREPGSLLIQVGYLEERLEALEEVIELEDYLGTARDCIKAIDGLAEPQWHRTEEVEEMVRDIEAAAAEHAYKHAKGAIEESIRKVRVIQSDAKAHSLNQEFLSALENRDASALSRCFEKLGSLERGRQDLSKRDELETRVGKVTPNLGARLRSTFDDTAWDKQAESFKSAWAYKQGDKWLSKFSREHDKSTLELALKALLEEEKKTISQLAAAKAWDNCLRSLTTYRRNNLMAWATTMKKIGKGTGKRAPMYRKQAKEYMDNCKGAIPAWIMPLYRVFETVSPDPEAFDAVIIDEASQTGPEGLVIEYLGKQCIIVGDSEQIAPEAVGIDQSAVDTLVKRYLNEIPFKGLYNPQTSLFDFANILYSGKIVLREHFRCMPEIIQFSNELCYKATPLKPLRQYPPRRLEPILVQQVMNGWREGSASNALNRPEADELVETIAEMCSSREYAGKTMGVISLQGEAQAKFIENKLLTRLSPTDLESRRIVCGDAYAFQGDERDIMFLSMVAAPNERIGALVRESDKRRFNVAASRAKDQLVLFHTATLNELHPECMRYKLLEYCLNPTRQYQEVDLSRCESQFEREVCQAIASRGYKVIPQYRVAEYRIDLVVEGVTSQLAVECDGDEWHGIEQYEQDVARQRILERCDWRFWRIRGYEYYRDPISSLESLWRALAELDITPRATSEREKHAADIKQEEGIPSATQPYMQPEEAAQLKGAPDSVRQEEGKANIGDDKKEGPSKEAGGRARRPGDTIPRVIESEIYNYPADYFFSLARWAKENGKLDSWERHLVFNIGRYMHNRWQITQRMERQALRIMREAKEAGFSEGKSEA